MMSARCPAQRPASSPTCAARRGARVAATPRARRAARAFASPAASLPPAFAPHAGAAVPFDALRAPQQLVAQLGEGLETPVQLLYLAALLALLAAGSYLVVRQVLVRRELENAAKELGERVRSGDASAADHFEMGCVLLRKKVYGAAVKNLESALDRWDASSSDAAGKAQVHNALGFALFSQGLEGKAGGVERALEQYKAAVALQPGYVTAWNNMGAALEERKRYGEALSCYKSALQYAPANETATERSKALATRLDRMAGTSSG